MAVVFKRTGTLVPRKALPPLQLGAQVNCVCNYLLRHPLPACPSPQGHGCPSTLSQVSLTPTSQVSANMTTDT